MHQQLNTRPGNDTHTSIYNSLGTTSHMAVTNYKGSRNCSFLCLRGGAGEVKLEIFVNSTNDCSPYKETHLEGCCMLVQVGGLSF